MSRYTSDQVQEFLRDGRWKRINPTLRMRPYECTEIPHYETIDPHDIKKYGRKSIMGKLQRFVNEQDKRGTYRGYSRSKSKREIRRMLRKRDRQYGKKLCMAWGD